MDDGTERGSRATLAIASALFCLSGGTALVWEVVWLKRFSQLWGSSALALASVVAAFLTGLGLGALLFGLRADRMRRPLLAYALCEIGIGLLAILVPFAISLLFGVTVTLRAITGGSPLLLAVARYAVTLAVLGPPCVLMGGTLPLLVRHYRSVGRPLGESTAWLYAANALGAAAGAWLAGFHFLPTVGLAATGNVAVALNLLVGFAALAVARSLPGAEVEPVPPTPTTGGRRTPGPILVAAGMVGLGALMLQMLWARQMALILGGSTYAFSAMLALFVLGVGLGSLLFRVLRPSAQAALAAAAALVVGGTLLGLELGTYLTFVVGAVRTMRTHAGFDTAISAGVGALTLGLPTLGLGLAFPALVQLVGRGRGSGRAVGWVYGANTAGSIAGATFAGAILVPAIGSFLGFRIALLLVVGALVLVFPPVRLPARRESLLASAFCVLALVTTWRRADPRDMNMGRFLYGPEDARTAAWGTEPVYFHEGPTSNVLVLEGIAATGPPEAPPGTIPMHMRVNGKVDAANTRDMLMQLGQAYFARMIHPGACEVLVIGLGSGTTCGASLLFPDTRVLCCEIEPGVAAAARLFAPENHDPFASPDFELVLDDGRAFVQGADALYDLILSEPSNPWLAGVSNLYTVEFYEAVARRLKPGGLLAQWVQMYGLTPEQYALIVRTATSVFPDASLLRVSEHDTILIVGPSGAVPDRADLDAAQALVDGSAAVREDLLFWWGSTDVRSLLLEHLWLGRAELRALAASVGDGGVITDHNLRLEFDAPRDLFRGEGLRVETHRVLLAATDPRFRQKAFLNWGCGPEQVEALRGLKTLLFQEQLPAHASALVELALAYEPDDPELMTDRLLFGRPLPEPEFRALAERLLSLSPLESYRLGQSLAQTGRVEAALTVLEDLVVALPDSATAWSSLAAVYATLGREADARRAVEKAAALDPMNDLARGMVRALGE